MLLGRPSEWVKGSPSLRAQGTPSENGQGSPSKQERGRSSEWVQGQPSTHEQKVARAIASEGNLARAGNVQRACTSKGVRTPASEGDRARMHDRD